MLGIHNKRKIDKPNKTTEIDKSVYPCEEKATVSLSRFLRVYAKKEMNILFLISILDHTAETLMTATVKNSRWKHYFNKLLERI